MIFTFTKHPIEYLLEHHYEMFSSVQKLVAIYSNDDKGNLKSIVKSKTNKESLNITNFIKEIDVFRSDPSPFSWFDESSLPFRIRQSGIFQQELFDEINKTVLLLRITSQNDNKHDLLFIYFDKSISNLALSTGKENKLSGETKPIIAKLLYNSVMSIISDARANQDILKSNFNPGTQAIIHSLNTLKKQHTELKTQFNNTFLKLTKSLFYKYIDENKHQLTLSNDAISKLIEYNGDHEELENIIKSTVDFINTLYLENLPKTITIEEYLINTDSNRERNNHQQEANKYNKTITLLDNLNEAVKKVITQNQNPTGAIVGRAMNKPISAPAITDALKNHKSKILTLIDKYPNRWTELKQFFKPIQNISINNTGHRRISV